MRACRALRTYSSSMWYSSSESCRWDRRGRDSALWDLRCTMGAELREGTEGEGHVPLGDHVGGVGVGDQSLGHRLLRRGDEPAGRHPEATQAQLRRALHRDPGADSTADVPQLLLERAFLFLFGLGGVFLGDLGVPGDVGEQLFVGLARRGKTLDQLQRGNGRALGRHVQVDRLDEVLPLLDVLAEVLGLDRRDVLLGELVGTLTVAGEHPLRIEQIVHPLIESGLDGLLVAGAGEGGADEAVVVAQDRARAHHGLEIERSAADGGDSGRWRPPWCGRLGAGSPGRAPPSCRRARTRARGRSMRTSR